VLPLAVQFSLAASSADCCGAASSTLSQMTELLVSSLAVCVTHLIWSSLCRCGMVVLVTWCTCVVYPRTLKNRYLTWSLTLNDANGKILCQV
jgi:hypothetical protein